MRRLLIVLGAIALLMVVALPAGATVHEQVGAACGGQKDLAPPGISGGSNANADNFAKPVESNGVVVFTGLGPSCRFHRTWPQWSQPRDRGQSCREIPGGYPHPD